MTDDIETVDQGLVDNDDVDEDAPPSPKSDPVEPEEPE